MKYSMFFKVSAAILCFIMICVAIGSAVGIYFCIDKELYTEKCEDAVENELRDMLENEAVYIWRDAKGSKMSPANLIYSFSEGRNIKFTVLKSGEEYANCYGGEKYLASAEFGYEGKNEGNDFKVTAYCLADMKYDDEYSEKADIIRFLYSARFIFIASCAVSVIAAIFLIVYILCAAGHRRGTDEVKRGFLEYIPFDVHTVLTAFLAYLMICFAEDFSYGVEETIISIAVCLVGGYLLLLQYFMSFAVRIKLGTVFKGTLIWQILKLIGKFFRRAASVFRDIPIIWRTALTVFVLLTADFFAFLCADNGTPGPGIVLFILVWATIIYFALSVSRGIKKLDARAKSISEGNYKDRIDLRTISPWLKKSAHTLNTVGDGMNAAVEERLKSERFKTELITNVSHDLKTPITSIINYVDLLKKENIESETVLSYIDVLDRQSNRLKKLAEDLIEASRASTGNVSLNLEKCELCELFEQLKAEYSDKLSEHSLVPVISNPDTPVYIIADSRSLIRIIDNLMSNIIKYSMEGTRVYISLERIEGKAVMIFKNISGCPLNVSGELLEERFVRGDSSRHSEGSGLGLSIAKSLTELQHGTLGAYVDGDLFKVILSFDMCDYGGVTYN